MAFENHWAAQRLTTRYFGNLTSKDLIEANSATIGSAQYEEIDTILISFDEIESYDVGEKDVLIAVEFALRNNRYNPLIPVAIVSADPVLRPLIDQYIHCTELEIPHARQALFFNNTEAEAWLIDQIR
ncbi:hypothetical protein [Oceanospirillum sanctuarii]|uniref:hypothetical protein n=1 Tax=Oceanospirillum sanctuarii TaxID=1434821 RepID=UPI000A37E814|nr:hypothetical protein [Oceanospirillum sanctuarii]